jgi:hypothetical protein
MAEKLEDLIDKASTHTESHEAAAKSGKPASVSRFNRKLVPGLLLLVLVNTGVLIYRNSSSDALLADGVAELFSLASSQLSEAYRISGRLPESLEDPVLATLVDYTLLEPNRYALAYPEEGSAFSVTLEAGSAFSPEMLRQE